MKMLGLESNRLNRCSYILTTLVSMFAFVGIGLIFGAALNVLLGPIDSTMSDSPHPLGIMPFMFFWLIYFLDCTAKRFHDMNLSGWLCLVAFMPFISLIFGVLLIFTAGTDGVNKYGEPLKDIRVMGFSWSDRKI